MIELKPEQKEQIERDADRVCAEMKEVFSMEVIPSIKSKFEIIEKTMKELRWLKRASRTLSDIERLIKAYSARKPRKTTFKTIRKDCAKRNSNK